MRLIWMPAIFLTLLTSSALPASAQATSQLNGYRNCSPRNLAVCDNSNELFFGPARNGRGVAKHEFPQALNRFLKGAPEIYFNGHSFTPAQVAQESILGPGGRHDRLSGGEWFFDGFTPHDAPDIGAAIFDSAGNILLVATSDADTDSSTEVAGSERVLRIYIHAPEPRQDLIRYTQNWAQQAADTRNKEFPSLPPEKISRAELYAATKDLRHWDKRPLP